MKVILVLIGSFISSLMMFLYVKVTLPFFTLLDTFDKWLMQVLNFDGGVVTDNFFYFISSKKAWIPIGALFIYSILTNKKLRGNALLIIACVAITVTICDQVSSTLIKPAVERLRPSHCDSLSGVLHFVNNYRSSRFGFCSSHAANATGVFVFVSMLYRKRKVVMPLLIWTVLVCYSRIYLGVHYPGDVICGCLIGVASAMFVFRFYNYCCKMIRCRRIKRHTKQPALVTAETK